MDNKVIYMFKDKAKLLFKRLCFCGIIIAAAACISNNWYQLMLIQGESMLPAYHNLQMVILDKHSESYERSAVIAFKCEALDAVLVKRIVGGPGDRIKISNGKLWVNEELADHYAEEYFEYAGILAEEQVLGEEQYIVIGDNIEKSKDSRYESIGVIREDTIVGVVCDFR